MKRFCVRHSQDLGKAHEYRYYREKSVISIDISETEELHRYEYSIMKKLDRDIESRHGFGYLIIADKLLQV